MALSPEIQEKVDQWLNGNFDESTRQAVKHLLEQGDEKALTDAFYKDLEFGTGGLRGIMGVGTNRMNKYTVAMATQGLFNYLKKSFPGEQVKIVIAYDSRNYSDFFTEVTAQVMAANGALVYIFDSLRPTPELSFAIRYLGCHSGVVITASHNPKEYNGYKAYWKDGGQLVPPHDKNVIAEVQKIQSVDDVKFDKAEGNIQDITQEVDEAYLKELEQLSVSGAAIQRQKDLKIVFTPLHGTAIKLVPQILKRFGFEQVTVVEEQAEPDGNFPTVKKPNPEENSAMEMALNKARQINADLVLATDPDADRVGIAVKNDQNEFELLNGNQTGSLLIYYMLNAWQEAGKITGNEFIVKTIVTSDLIKRIAEKFGVECYDTLTGFKYIAEKIKELEGKKQFIAGGEESYGYLIGDKVRDKDAVASCAMIAEMTAYAKDNGKSLYELLKEMYHEFGFYKEDLISIEKEGKEGAEAINKMMEQFRFHPPEMLDGSKVVTLIDYNNAQSWDLKTGRSAPVHLPKSNVIQLFTEEGAKITARPSGTEPKIKFYFSVNKPLDDVADFDKVNRELEGKISNIIKEMELA